MLKIFIIAVAIRWTYALILYGTMGDSGLVGVDSSSYLQNAAAPEARFFNADLMPWSWLSTESFMMPLFAWLLTGVASIAGKYVTIVFVLLQSVVDGLTCVMVGALANTIDRRLAWPAALIAAANPTQVVLSGYVYTDTLFTFFVALIFLATARYLQHPAFRTAALIGVGLGCAVMTRELIMPWGIFLLLFILISLRSRRSLSMTRVTHICTAAAIYAACMIPTMASNYGLYGTWSLSPKSGMHLSRWIVPLVREAKDGTPWATGNAEVEQLTVSRFGPTHPNPFLQSRRYQEIGIEELKRLGIDAMAKAWIVGAAINLAAPAIILSPPVMSLPRTGFYATTGQSITEKISKFLFHSDNALYAWLLLIGVGGVAVFRVVQLIGLIEIFRTTGNLWIGLMLVGWCGYILAVNGPVASPKYRLPIEPVLAVFTAAGALRLLRYRGPEPV